MKKLLVSMVAYSALVMSGTPTGVPYTSPVAEPVIPTESLEVSQRPMDVASSVILPTNRKPMLESKKTQEVAAVPTPAPESAPDELLQALDKADYSN